MFLKYYQEYLCHIFLSGNIKGNHLDDNILEEYYISINVIKMWVLNTTQILSRYFVLQIAGTTYISDMYPFD